MISVDGLLKRAEVLQELKSGRRLKATLDVPMSRSDLLVIF
jgi:hypothetical protein